MIAHRVVTHLPLIEGAHAPAVEDRGGQQLARHRSHHLRRNDPGEQAVAGIGAAHGAGLAIAIEGQGIGADRVAPEGRMEAEAQVQGLLKQGLRLAMAIKSAQDPGHRPAGAVGVGLHLTQGDRPLGVTPVGVVHRIVGILPALVAQAPLGRTAIAQKTIEAGRLRGPDPGHGGLQGRQQTGDEAPIGAALEVIARQHHEQRRGVHRAVVLAKGHLAEGRHFPQPRLMQDLAGFGVAGRVVLMGLVLSQKPEHSPGQARLHQEQLTRRDQSVAAEGTAEPGHAGKGIEPVLKPAGEQVHIGVGALDPAVQGRIVGDQSGGAAAGLIKPRDRGGQGRIEQVGRCGGVGRQRGTVGVEIEHQTEAPGHPRLQFQMQAEVVLAPVLRWRSEPQEGAASLPVEPPVGELEAIGQRPGHQGPAPLPGHAAHLEDVAEIGITAQGQGHPHRLRLKAGETELLHAGGGSEQGAALQVHRTTGGGRAALVLVAEVAHMQPHLAPFGGAQHRGRPLPEQQLQAAQMAGAAVKDAGIGVGLGADLAAAVEHREGLSVLENERRQLVMRHAAPARCRWPPRQPPRTWRAQKRPGLR